MIISNKKDKLSHRELCYFSGPQRKGKGRKALRPCQRTKKSVEHESDCETSCNLRTLNDTQSGLRELENRRMNRDHPSYCMVEIGQNTEKSPGDLRRIAVTQTSMKNYQWCEKLKRSIIIIIINFEREK